MTSKRRISYSIQYVRKLQSEHVPVMVENMSYIVFITELLHCMLLCRTISAKLSDSGLARDGPTGDKSHVSTRVMGTRGYAGPEYLATGINCGFVI